MNSSLITRIDQREKRLGSVLRQGTVSIRVECVSVLLSHRRVDRAMRPGTLMCMQRDHDGQDEVCSADHSADATAESQYGLKN